MRTITLNMQNGTYNQVILLLKNINHNDLEIIEKPKQPITKHTQQKMQELFKNKKVKMFQNLQNPLEQQNKQREEW